MGWGDEQNYDGGTPISSINGATQKGQDGFHDPSQAPPAGFSNWQEVGEHNMAVINTAAQQQDALEAQGYSYHRYGPQQGTWTHPSRPDVNGLGGQLPDGALGIAPDQRGRWGEQAALEPGPYGSQGQLDEGDPDNDEESLPDFAVSNSIFGRLLKLFGR